MFCFFGFFYGLHTAKIVAKFRVRDKKKRTNEKNMAQVQSEVGLKAKQNTHNSAEERENTLY